MFVLKLVKTKDFQGIVMFCKPFTHVKAGKYSEDSENQSLSQFSDRHYLVKTNLCITLFPF